MQRLAIFYSAYSKFCQHGDHNEEEEEVLQLGEKYEQASFSVRVLVVGSDSVLVQSLEFFSSRIQDQL